MPRNDQITRQWHLLRQLDGSSGRSLQELVDNAPGDHPRNRAEILCHNNLSLADQYRLRGRYVAG